MNFLTTIIGIVSGFTLLNPSLLSARSSEIAESLIAGEGCELTSIMASDGKESTLEVGGAHAVANQDHLFVNKRCLVKLKLNIPAGFQIGITAATAQGESSLSAHSSGKAQLAYRFIGDEVEGRSEQMLEPNEMSSDSKPFSLEAVQTAWSECGSEQITQATLKINLDLTLSIPMDETSQATANLTQIIVKNFVYKKCAQI